MERKKEPLRFSLAIENMVFYLMKVILKYYICIFDTYIN